MKNLMNAVTEEDKIKIIIVFQNPNIFSITVPCWCLKYSVS